MENAPRRAAASAPRPRHHSLPTDLRHQRNTVDGRGVVAALVRAEAAVRGARGDLFRMLKLADAFEKAGGFAG